MTTQLPHATAADGSEEAMLRQQLVVAREHQAATSEILRIISRSPTTDLQAVLDAIAAQAARLCNARLAAVSRVEGGGLRLAAHHGALPVSRSGEAGAAARTPVDRTSVNGRAVVDRRTLHIHDLAAESDDEFPTAKALQKRDGTRTILVVPLLHDDSAIGTISVRRQRVRPFTTPEIALLETFADQAVLAIEHTRLFQELEDRTVALERSNAELEQFAYVASHDLQEPLRTVSSYVQLLAERYAGQLDARADRYIGHSVTAVERMHTLINDLLAYSRVGTRGRDLAPTNVASVLDHVLEGLAVTIRETGADITWDRLPSVRADATQLGQLFQNLLGNALKYRSERPPRIHIGVERRGGHWQLAVRDNGIGIDPQYAKRIFLVFQRLHSWDEHPGSGIGLAICEKIVERHGGQLWVESQVGQGATFFFTLPVMGDDDG